MMTATQLKRLRADVEKHGIRRLARETGIGRRTLQYLCKGWTVPQPETVAKIRAVMEGK
jgi:DNA-binding phage protein